MTVHGAFRAAPAALAVKLTFLPLLKSLRPLRALRETMLLLLFASVTFAAVDPEVSMSVLSMEKASSFAPLLRLKISNGAFAAVDLGELVDASELVVDGKTSKRSQDASFEGPAGIQAQADWEGCVSPADYVPAVTPGTHKVRFVVGGSHSPDIALRMTAPLDWRKGNLKTRMAEVSEMAKTLKKGTPRSCVELWLPELDGGLEEEHRVRYYVEPQIKVVVPYMNAGDGGREHDVVAGPIEVYQEPYLAD